MFTIKLCAVFVTQSVFRIVFQSVLSRVCGIGVILIGKRVDGGGGRGEALLFFRNTDVIQKYKTFQYRNTTYTNKKYKTKELQNKRNMTIQ